MSSQKGNVNRTRPPKYKNRTVFKNNLHDTSHRTKLINNIQVSDVCVRCKEVIEWKIKYKKYKPLTQPRVCVKCGEKNVKQAYHVMCRDCGKKLRSCTKCCQNKEIVQTETSEIEQLKLDNELKNLLQSLPERKRRTFIRYMNNKGKDGTNDKENERNDLLEKLNTLKIDDNTEDFSDSDDFGENDSDETE